MKTIYACVIIVLISLGSFAQEHQTLTIFNNVAADKYEYHRIQTEIIDAFRTRSFEFFKKEFNLSPSITDDYLTSLLNQYKKAVPKAYWDEMNTNYLSLPIKNDKQNAWIEVTFYNLDKSKKVKYLCQTRVELDTTKNPVQLSKILLFSDPKKIVHRNSEILSEQKNLTVIDWGDNPPPVMELK